jgi:hypothetical protein
MQGMNWRVRLTKGLLRLTLVILLSAILWHYFSGLDFSQLALRINGGGFALLLVLLPYGLVFLMESLAWQLTLRSTPRASPEAQPESRGFLSQRRKDAKSVYGSTKTTLTLRLGDFARAVWGFPYTFLGKLYLIRMATDALLYSIPGGVAVAESTRPVLLQKQCGVELTEGIGSGIITKINIAVAQVIYVLLGFILVTVFYPSVAQQLGVGNGFTGYLSVGLSLLCALALLTLPFSGPRLTQFFRALSHLPIAPIRRLIVKAEPTIGRLDAQVGRFARDHTRHFVFSVLFSFASWVFVAVESYLILKFLGAEPTFTQAVALESTASILRILFFFLPAGIGASEVGFITLLVAFGFPDAITLGAAYIAVKRLKEAGWVVMGYLVLWFVGFNPFKRVNTDPLKSRARALTWRGVRGAFQLDSTR